MIRRIKDKLANAGDIGVEVVRLLNSPGTWETLSLARAQMSESGLKGSQVVQHLRSPKVRESVADGLAQFASLVQNNARQLKRGCRICVCLQEPAEQD